MSRYKIINHFLKKTRGFLLNETYSGNFLGCGDHWRHAPIRCCSNELTATENPSKEPSALDPVEKLDLSDYGAPLRSRFNFAMYADKSPLIQRYIDLGVNLYQVEKDPKNAQYMLTLTNDKINAYLRFLIDNGVPEDMLGEVITKNPAIFREDLDDLQVRINYLKSKKFDKGMISTIIQKSPKWLSTSVKAIDERLGYIQHSLKLKGDDIRSMVTRAPSLALIEKKRILLSLYALKEEMFLDDYTLKSIVIAEPSLLRKDPYEFIDTYNYLIKTMKVARDLVLKQPKVLTSRKFFLKERHRYLQSLGRAQYCHLLPGYVSLMDLTVTSDAEFCERIAKTSEEMYNNFLKTL